MRRVAFIGAGRMGQTIAYSALMDGIADEALIFDIVANVPQRFSDELIHALSTARVDTRVIGTNAIEDIKEADLVVISAGKPRLPDQSRTAVFADNAKVMMALAKELPMRNPHATYIVVTNPVDYMASIFMKSSGKYTISTGAQVENMRMRSFIAQRLGVPVTSVNGFAGGEHGENLSIFWDTVTVNGIPFDEASGGALKRDEVASYVKGIAAQVIAALGGTSWGPSRAIGDIISSFAKNKNKVLSIAAPMKYKDEVIHVSRPTVVGNPIGPTLEAALSSADRKDIDAAAGRMYKEYKELLKTLQ